MSLVYVDSGLSVYPPAANGVNLTPSGTSFANSAWFEIHAGIPADWAVVGICFQTDMPNGGSGAANDRGYFNLQLGTGGAGAETGIATIDGDFISEITCPWQVLYLSVPKRVASGSRLSVRLAKFGVYTQTWRIALLYYTEPLVGSATIPILTGSVTRISSTISLPAGDWAWSSWTQLTAATASDLLLSQISVACDYQTARQFEAQIGIGAAAAEVAVASVRGFKGSNGFSLSFLAGGLREFPVWPLRLIPSGSRVSCRIRKSVTGTASWTGIAALIPSPITTFQTSSTSNWAPDTAPSLSLGSAAVNWANSSWVTVLAAAADNLTVIGVFAGITTGTSDNAPIEIDIGVGNAGEEELLTTFRMRPYVGSLQVGMFMTQLPIGSPTVAAGARIAARYRSGSLVGRLVNVAVQYIEDTTFEQRGAIQKVYPAAAADATATANTVAWANSSYAQLTAATTEDILLTGYTIFGFGTTDQEVDIATGAGGAEVVVATVRMGQDGQNTVNHWNPLTYPIRVPSGTRIAMRGRKASTVTGTWGFALTYVPQGGDTPPDPPPAEEGLGGIYILETAFDIAQTRDTLYITEDSDETAVFKIPDPFIKTAMIGD